MELIKLKPTTNAVCSICQKTAKYILKDDEEGVYTLCEKHKEEVFPRWKIKRQKIKVITPKVSLSGSITLSPFSSKKQKLKVMREIIDPEAFECIEFENNDVDTDRGTMRDRSYNIVFETHSISLSEKDFIDLVSEIKKSKFEFEY